MSDEGWRRFLAAYPVSRETLERLDALADALARWNRSINLVSARSLADLWRRHILDSAQLAPLAPPTARSWVDLGAGGGFPGLVVAALAQERRPTLHMTLVESDTRKCAFLANAARAMALDVTIENRRIEQPPPRRHDVVSARALAPLSRLLDLAAPYMAEGAVALFPKGAGVDAELTEAMRKRHIEVARAPSITDPHGVILQVRGV